MCQVFILIFVVGYFYFLLTTSQLRIFYRKNFLQLQTCNAYNTYLFDTLFLGAQMTLELFSLFLFSNSMKERCKRQNEMQLQSSKPMLMQTRNKLFRFNFVLAKMCLYLLRKSNNFFQKIESIYLSYLKAFLFQIQNAICITHSALFTSS